MARLPPAKPSPPPRYPWLQLRFSRAQRLATLTGGTVGITLVVLYRWYLQGDDVGAESIFGLACATIGTILLILVGVGYALRKRWALTWPGLLSTFLAWHMVGGLLGLLLIYLHTAGIFEQTSGVYTFYGLLGIVASGLIGRVLDRVCPHLAAQAALQALSASNREQLEALEAATRRERFFLWPIGAWRQVHKLISLLAFGLLLWHLAVAAIFLLHTS